MPDVLGLTVEEASEKIESTVRVTVEDGEELNVTMDFNDTRLNVGTQDGIIVEVFGWG